MYNIEQLRMFVEAVELGSFSASARKLGKVQSAVSQGISNLEIDFDIQLFDRSTRKPTLTKEGQQIFKQAKAIVLQVEDLSVSVQSINNHEEDMIKLAFDDSLLMPTLPKILDAFSQRFPATEVELMAVASTDVIPLITDKRADIGLMFTNLAFSKEIEPCFIGNLPFSSVCHPEHPLANSGKVGAKDLVMHRQLMLRGYGEESLEQFPIIAGKVWWSNNFGSIRQLLLHSNLGWAYLPTHLVCEDIKSKKLVEIDITFDHKAWCPPIDLVTSKRGAKGPALSWLEEHLKQLID
ncbi:LysR family transcriptional regulator [Vibrio sp. T187]|uniref:LysR family transcriptional regulator n=1 Tax=Vibrio TaxID=662 RepID=UPI0010C94E31|nr:MULTISPECIES: LysR family transcriptional regulator [Vibrio]MBW3696702.1 LysR family transcriptional regulator [Vibrio sp. T187]